MARHNRWRLGGTPHWFAAQLRHAAAGPRVVAGTVTVEDWHDRNHAVRDRARKEYRATPHRHIHGANLSFAATAYCATDGFRPVTCDEDVLLIDAFTANAEPIAWRSISPWSRQRAAKREPRAALPVICRRWRIPTKEPGADDYCLRAVMDPSRPRNRPSFADRVYVPVPVRADRYSRPTSCQRDPPTGGRPLVASGERPAVDIVTHQRTDSSGMQRWFVACQTGPTRRGGAVTRHIAATRQACGTYLPTGGETQDGWSPTAASVP
jgi:hypothetical protein